MLDTLLYTPLPASQAPPVACDYTLTFADDAARTVFCSFTRGRCGPHHCPLNKFDDKPAAKSAVPQGSFYPWSFDAG